MKFLKKLIFSGIVFLSFFLKIIPLNAQHSFPLKTFNPKDEKIVEIKVFDDWEWFNKVLCKYDDDLFCVGLASKILREDEYKNAMESFKDIYINKYPLDSDIVREVVYQKELLEMSRPSTSLDDIIENKVHSVRPESDKERKRKLFRELYEMAPSINDYYIYYYVVPPVYGDIKRVNHNSSYLYTIGINGKGLIKIDGYHENVEDVKDANVYKCTELLSNIYLEIKPASPTGEVFNVWEEEEQDDEENQNDPRVFKGLYDAHGKSFLLKPKYEDFKWNYGTYIEVKKGDNLGLVTRQEKEIIPANYKKISIFDKGTGGNDYFLAYGDDLKNFKIINKEGKEIAPNGKYSMVWELHGNNLVVSKNGKKGLIDYNSGKELIAPLYNEILGSGNSKFVTMNKSGNSDIVYILSNTGQVLQKKTITNPRDMAFFIKSNVPAFISYVNF